MTKLSLGATPYLLGFEQLERLLERHLGFDLLARFEALLDDGNVNHSEANDLLDQMECIIVDLESEVLSIA